MTMRPISLVVKCNALPKTALGRGPERGIPHTGMNTDQNSYGKAASPLSGPSHRRLVSVTLPLTMGRIVILYRSL